MIHYFIPDELEFHRLLGTAKKSFYNTLYPKLFEAKMFVRFVSYFLSKGLRFEDHEVSYYL